VGCGNELNRVITRWLDGGDEAGADEIRRIYNISRDVFHHRVHRIKFPYRNKLHVSPDATKKLELEVVRLEIELKRVKALADQRAQEISRLTGKVNRVARQITMLVEE
jgi:hypothetical protein